MNLIFICTALKQMYNVVVRELLYDSELEKNVHSQCAESGAHGEISDSFPSDDSISSDDNYMQVFRRKNVIQAAVFMKKSLCFIIIDELDNCYGIYYPGIVDRELNCCVNVSLFSLTKGIEIDMRKYRTTSVFSYISFTSDGWLMEMGAKTWLLRIYDDRIVFNDNQNVLETYNHTLMKSARIKQLIVLNCS